MRLNGKLAVIGAASLLVLASCASVTENLTENIAEEAIERALESESDGNVEIDLDLDGDSGDGGFSVTVEGEDGTESLDMGSNASVPDELIVPVPSDGKVAMSMSDENEGHPFISTIVIFNEDRFEELVDFYENWLDDEGYSYDRTTMEFDYTMVLFVTNDNEDGMVDISISVHTQESSDDGTEVGVAITTTGE